MMKKKKNIKIINLNHIPKYDFKKSSIIKCKINNEEINKNNYRYICNTVYKIINNGTKIIKNTTLNIKTVEDNQNGFYYLDNIGISIQGAESNKTLYEILNQANENNINVEMTIELENKTIVDIFI